MELNETKLANAVGASGLRPALSEEVRAVGAEPGYGSPLGVEGAIVVVDDAIPDSPNLVAGANEEGFHFLNVNYERDFGADTVADIASAGDGSLCPECGAAMRAVRGVEVGNIFKLGTRYSEAFGASFLDKDGRRKPVVMGCYGIGLGRLLACIAEEHHDENGLVWPVSVAPYHVHIVAAGADEMAEGLYGRLVSAGRRGALRRSEREPGGQVQGRRPDRGSHTPDADTPFPAKGRSGDQSPPSLRRLRSPNPGGGRRSQEGDLRPGGRDLPWRCH